MQKNLIAVSLILTSIHLFAEKEINYPEILIPFESSIHQEADVTAIPSTQKCDPSPHLYRVEMKHREHQGVGYKTGYSSLDLFLPYWNNESTYLFVDGRGHIFDNGKWAANAGLGVRYLKDSWNTVFGANIFYDYRQANHRGNFNQVGGGVELLWKDWDFRANGYWPVGKTVQYDKPGALFFQGHNVLLYRKAQYAMRGGNAEIGANFIDRKYFKGHLALGGYCFTSDHIKKTAAGPTVRLTADISSYFTIEGQYSYDSVFKNIVQGMIAFNISFGKKVKTKNTGSCTTSIAMQNRLLEPVQRFEIIVEKDKKQTFYALNPLTGGPLNIIFVNNLAPDADGSIEHPYPTLLQGEQNSKPGDVIYVFAGDGTTKGMDTGINLKDDQSLLGSAFPYAFNTKIGIQTLSAQTLNSPTITNSVGNVINLANNNTINGFNIEVSIEAAAIHATFPSLNNLTISNNKFIATGIAAVMGHAIKLETGTTSGNILISNNRIDQFVNGVKIFTSGTYNLKISNNNFNNTFSSLNIQPQGAGTITLVVNNNTLQSNSNFNPAIYFFDANLATVTGVIENNTLDATPIGADALYFNGQGNILIKNNIANANPGNFAINITNPFTPNGLTAVVKNNKMTGGFNIDGNGIQLKILDNTSSGTANFYTLDNNFGNMVISSPDGTVAGGTYNQSLPVNPSSFDFPSGSPAVYPIPQTTGDSFP